MIEYLQKFQTNYTKSDGLSSDDIRSVVVDRSDRIFAGTSKGLCRFDGEKWIEIWEIENISKIYADRNGQLSIIADGKLFISENHLADFVAHETEFEITAISEGHDGQIWIGGENQIRGLNGETQNRFDEKIEIRSIAVVRDDIWIATNLGLICYNNNSNSEKIFTIENSELPSNDLRCVDLDSHGHLWIGSDRGVSVFDRDSEWYQINGKKSGLPYEDVYQIVRGDQGQRWIGTSIGAVLWQNGKWEYFHSKRWIADDRVNSIAVQKNGTAWIATSGGISKIEKRPYTLAQKAEHFEKQISARHDRYGFVTSCRLERSGDISSYIPYACDNDGLWTALYVAAECFRYATTGEIEAKNLAKRSLKNLIWLEEITQIDGFPARSIIEKGERVDQSGGEWHDTSDGNWEWKGDTSSDEIDGHFFAQTIYFDLVADDQEKKEIAEVADRIASHIVDNDFLLIDLDGERTSWGVWSPRLLNGEWRLQRNLNSLEVLSFLKSAYHITENEKYQNAYLDLIQNHHYALNSIDQKLVPLHQVSHSDDELAILAYYPLLKYETDPDLRAIYLLGFERSWQIERPERNPLWNFAYGAITGNAFDLEKSIETLQKIPMDLIYWSVKNSHRSDIEIAPEEPYLKQIQSVDPVSPDERRPMKWNGNPYELDSSHGGRAEEDGTFFLLPYWMGRYHKLI